MSEKRIVRLERADRDMDDAIAYYLENGGKVTALAFVDALEQALRHISRYPGSGTTRHADQLKLPGLRCWPVKRYPYLIFFVEHEEHIDVWRVLHTARDIPAVVRTPPGT